MVAITMEEDPPTGVGSRVPKLVGLLLAPPVLVGFFWLGGGADWVGGWVWFGAMLIGQVVSTFVVRHKDPELIRRRGEYGEGTKPWDKVILGLFALAYLVLLATAALDVRFGWAEPMAWWWAAVGVVVYAAGTVLLTWAMRVNTYFEKSVRIQLDRDHKVVNGGPYRFVRHPGYVATILSFAMAAPLLLGSWFACLPAAAVVVLLVVRTALEDRTLVAELEGYASYAKRTRYRLLPGVW